MDGEAWLELTDTYLEYMKYFFHKLKKKLKNSYNKAIFCLEELILLFPKKLFYMMKIAEVNTFYF